MQLLHIISVCVYNSDSGENGNHKQPTILQCCCSKWTGSDSNVIDDVVNVFLPCMYSSTLEKEHFVFFFSFSSFDFSDKSNINSGLYGVLDMGSKLFV